MAAKQKGLIGWILLIILAGLIAGAVLVVGITPKSLPGDLIYPIKLILEDFRLSQNEFSFAGRADVYLDMTQARLSEIKELARQRNKDKEIVATVSKLLEVQAKGINSIERSRGEKLRGVYDKLEYILQKEQK